MKYAASITKMAIVGQLVCSQEADVLIFDCYDVSAPSANMVIDQMQPGDDEFESIERRFNQLREKWQKETGHYPLVEPRYSHPAYQEILAMGKSVVPFILNELRTRPDRWFAALRVLTKENPGESCRSFDDLVSAWIEWGKNIEQNV